MIADNAITPRREINQPCFIKFKMLRILLQYVLKKVIDHCCLNICYLASCIYQFLHDDF